MNNSPMFRQEQIATYGAQSWADKRIKPNTFIIAQIQVLWGPGLIKKKKKLAKLSKPSLCYCD